MDVLKELRQKKGVYQKDVAAFLDVDRTTYVKWENGDTEPNNDSIKKLADYFGVSTDYLLEHEEKSKSKDEKEIEKIIENTINDLESADGLMFDGKPANEEEIEQIKSAMRLGLAMAKEKAREKFTPKKYRNK